MIEEICSKLSELVFIFSEPFLEKFKIFSGIRESVQIMTSADFISFKASKFLLIIVINIFLTTLRLFIPKEMTIRWVIKIRSFLRITNCWANYINGCSN